MLATLQTLKLRLDLPARTLRTKVAIALLASMFTLLAVATVGWAVQDRRAFLADQTEKSIFLATTMARLIAEDGSLESLDHVQQQVKEFAKTPGIVSIRVINRTFTVVAASRSNTIGRTYRAPDLFEATKSGTTSTRIRGLLFPSVLEVATPIRARDQLVGALELGVDLTGNQTDLVTFIRRGILVALAAAGATTLFLLWSLTLVVVRPVARFAHLSEHLARGDFSVEFPRGGAEEIDQLGRALTRTRDSLRELSALWKDQNPLSGLPGNLAIERELRRRLDTGVSFAVLYADLDDFKAFNDRYGFDRGDQLLRFTATTLETAVKTRGGEGDFLGHVGGDDFILVVDADRAEPIAMGSIRSFDGGRPAFYEETDRQHGYITAEDRQGRPVRVSLAGLTVVGILVTASQMSVLSIGEAAAQLKAYAKRNPGSKFVMDHRTVQ